MSYNGWKNWETWNVALWLGNDEGLYSASKSLARALKDGKKISGVDAESIVRGLMPNGTPDFRSEHHGKRQGAALYRAVHWPSIAADLNEMAGL